MSIYIGRDEGACSFRNRVPECELSCTGAPYHDRSSLEALFIDIAQAVTEDFGHLPANQRVAGDEYEYRDCDPSLVCHVSREQGCSDYWV